MLRENKRNMYRRTSLSSCTSHLYLHMQVWASLAVELATVPVLPLDYTPYGQAMQGYVSSLQSNYATSLGVDLSSLMSAAEVGR